MSKSRAALREDTTICKVLLKNQNPFPDPPLPSARPDGDNSHTQAHTQAEAGAHPLAQLKNGKAERYEGAWGKNKLALLFSPLGGFSPSRHFIYTFPLLLLLPYSSLQFRIRDPYGSQWMQICPSTLGSGQPWDHPGQPTGDPSITHPLCWIWSHFRYKKTWHSSEQRADSCDARRRRWVDEWL